VSVRAEFDRHVGACIDFLEASSSEVAFTWATRLLEARAISRNDLNKAATRVLSFASSTPSIEDVEFSLSDESAAFREVCGPMLEISCLITGIRRDRASDG